MIKIATLFRQYVNHCVKNHIPYDADEFEEWVEREMQAREKEKASKAATKEAQKNNPKG